MKYIELIKEFFYKNKRKIILIGSITLIVSLFLVSSFLIYKVNKNIKVEKDIKETELIPKLTTIKDEVNEVEKIYVDIKGYVNNPGVYEIEKDKRVIDVIDKAGGLTKDANTKYINLSKKLNDEMVIIVYSNEEIEKLNIEKKIECNCEKITNDACLSGKEEEKSTLININTATLEELKELDGIGDVKAQAIINYRNENGYFKDIEDLKNVSGISESTYDKIKNFITTE